MPLTFNEAYKAWRNRTRSYSAMSMVRMVLAFFDRPVVDEMEFLKRNPWNLLLLVKWICQDRMLDSVRTPISSQQFDELRQELWDLPEKAGLGIRDTLSWRLFLRQRMYQQLAFQRRKTLGFVREAALLDRLPAEHPLRKLFEARLGVPLHPFIDMTFALAAAVLEGARVISLSWFDVFRRAYSPEIVQRFIEGIALTRQGLFDFCRSLPDREKKVASEYFEFTVFTRYPFLRDDHQLYLWHEAVFLRGMENFVHSILSEANAKFIESFSKIFERHVVAEARSTGVPFYGEDEIRSWLPPKTKVPDGLLAFGSCNVLIESKAGLYDESVMTVGHSIIFSQKTRALLQAANQGWDALAFHTSGKAPDFVSQAPIDYLLVVTNKELSAGCGTTLAKMYPEDKFVPPDEEAARTLPIAHIYVLSIEDYEALLSAVRLKEVDLPSFLTACVQRDADPATTRMYMSQHMAGLDVPYGTSEVIQAAVGASQERLKKFLPKGNS